MKKVFIDTIIFIDLIADRKPFSKFAIEIFKNAENKKLKLYTSSHVFATTHYLLKKYIDEATLRKILTDLLDYVNIVPIDLNIIKKSLISKHKDFEDAIQINASHNIDNLYCIVTRNVKDYKGAEIDVLTSDELIQKLK